jgi:hypothetical protein
MTPHEQVKARLTGKFGKARWQIVFSLKDQPDIMGEIITLLPEDELLGSLFLGHFIRRHPKDMQSHP